MRLSEHEAREIGDIVRQLAGGEACVRLFGSRLDDTARGGDVDLLLELPDASDNPALLAARVAGRVSRLMGGRKVDVVVTAPNLRRLPIHDVALMQGQRL